MYENFLKKRRRLLLSFEMKKNPIYPLGSNFIQRKQIFSEIRNLMKNYIFIHRSLNILSPPIRDETKQLQMGFIHTNALLRNDNYTSLYPVYAISLERFTAFLKKFFTLSTNSCITIKNLIKGSPYQLSIFSNELNGIVNMVVFDKALQLFNTLFLDRNERNAIKEQLIKTKNFQFVYLDPDNDQRRQLVNKIISICDRDNLDPKDFDCFLKKSINFTMINIEGILNNQELIFSSPKSITIKPYKEFFTDFILNFDDDKTLEY